MLKKKVNGSWSNISSVKRKTNGSWTNCTSVKKKYNGSWVTVYPFSNFILNKKNYLTRNYNSGYSNLSSQPFTTATVTNYGDYFQITAKGGSTKPSPSSSSDVEYYNVGFGNTIASQSGEGGFTLYIDQEITASNNTTVCAAILQVGYPYYSVVEKINFTNSRQTISIYVPTWTDTYYGCPYNLYFSIYASYNKFTGSTTTPSATAKIYGVWNSTKKYDLST